MKHHVLILLAFLQLTIKIEAQCVVSIQGPSQAISNCTGPQVSASASGPGPFQYTWSSPTLNIAAANSATTTVSTLTPGWHTLTVMVVDSNNCTAMATDSVEFFPPVTTFYQTYCNLPDSVCILDCPMMVQGWTYTDSLNNTVNLPLSACVGIMGPGSYALFGIYNMNCTVMHTYVVTEDCGSGSGCSASIQAPNQAISNCTGPQVSASASGPGPFQYTWSSPTLNIAAANSATTTVSTLTPGWHSLTLMVVDANNCTAMATDSIEFFPPVTTFYQTYCNLPDSVCILDCPMMVQGWTYTDSLNNTVNLPLSACVGIMGPGSYALFGIYNMNCTVMHTYVVTEDCGGMNVTEQVEGSLQITPNPFSGFINLTFAGKTPRFWMLWDLWGRKIAEGLVHSEHEQISTTWIPPGVYTLQLEYEGENRFQRLVK